MALRVNYRRPVAFDPVAFGRRLASAREWRGLEPKQLAAELGISTEAINRWERGGLAKPPNKLALEKLSELLSQPVEWLLSGTDPPWLTATAPVAGENLATALHQLADAVDELQIRAAERERAAPRATSRRRPVRGG
jgi:transcriptional regulator with XRE-family HTH domain